MNDATGNRTVLEVDLGAQELSVLMYEGIEQTYPYIASIKANEHDARKLIAVLDLFTEGCGIKHIEYVTIEG